MNNKKFKQICTDANTAAATIGYMMSEVACIYPISPSSSMAEYDDELSAKQVRNVFNTVTRVVEMQSEAGAAGAVHGSLSAGALTTTYTASQGLLLMIPNMYKIAGEMLPGVFHVSARSLATHALNIFGDHSDVMATRQTGFCLLASNSPQEAMDMALIAHVSAIKASLPFLHFFDGLRTSHEINKIYEVDNEVIKAMLPLKEIKNFKKNAHNPEHPKQTGTAQNQDVFFQNREAANKYYDQVYDIVSQTMNQFGELTGRHYQPFVYHGAKDATDVVVLMCSANETCIDVSKYLNDNGKKTGVISVHLYRPFNAKAFSEIVPNSVKNLTVLDRTKEPGSIGEPLYTDVVSALKENNRSDINVYGGRYGLGGKDFAPADALAVFENMTNTKPINHFSVGIVDDVTFKSLPVKTDFVLPDKTGYNCLFYGLGSDGTVSANKSTIKIIGNNTNKFVQAYFEYDSKKSGSLTCSHLRIDDLPITKPYTVKEADFIAIHNYTFVHNYDILKGIRKNAKVLINTELTFEQLCRDLPENFKQHIKEANAEVYTLSGFELARKCGLKNRISTIMQAAFFKISNVIDYDLAIKQMKEYAIKSYARKGQAIVDANIQAIDAAVNELKKVDVQTLINTKSQSFMNNKRMNDYYKNWILPIEKRLGDAMPVSQFDPSGTVPTGTTQYEKRGIAINIPTWIAENCIQCGQCTLVCPHGVIRPYLLDAEAVKHKPETLKTRPAIGMPGYEYVIQPSPLDCTGCESCARTCPAMKKALVMKNLNEQRELAIKHYEFLQSLPPVANIPFKPETVKGAQFLKPYFEFSGACAGCGETPYIKIATQLFGKNMIIANATGCSSIYGGSAPSCPYTKDQDNHGPSWGNSLFEDNAEFGYGMLMATQHRQNYAYSVLQELSENNISEELKKAIVYMVQNKITKLTNDAKNKLVAALKAEKPCDEKVKELVNECLENQDLFAKKSLWIIGGDGWAYDIGYGGLDHVLASGENVNILVLDTEVYSNTGGQSSKSTPTGSVAKFAASGKKTRKKDLGLMAMSYKNVYVAQCAMGANQQQLINALVEAESYGGPSLIICYAPCINHGLDMGNSQMREKLAVQTGYWNLYRYDPRKENPMSVDSPEPSLPYEEFLKGEARYATLAAKHPDAAKALFAEAAKEAKERRATYVKMKEANDLEIAKKKNATAAASTATSANAEAKQEQPKPEATKPTQEPKPEPQKDLKKPENKYGKKSICR
ncbi:MAG: pyruvate:ferredoxin (flavodoxin) oxidoreductase [Mycoplasma sp.]